MISDFIVDNYLANNRLESLDSDIQTARNMMNLYEQKKRRGPIMTKYC